MHILKPRQLSKNHQCRESRVCCCSLTALEPDEDCPIHSSGPWPPRCCICGRFITRTCYYAKSQNKKRTILYFKPHRK
jgi:hypothetical protein